MSKIFFKNKILCVSKITPLYFFGGVKNRTVCFPNNKENWKIKNLENGGKVEHFYRLHYPYYVFDEKILLIGDIMRFLQKCPELPLPPYFCPQCFSNTLTMLTIHRTKEIFPPLKFYRFRNDYKKKTQLKYLMHLF